jgi:hypothetical protein
MIHTDFEVLPAVANQRDGWTGAGNVGEGADSPNSGRHWGSHGEDGMQWSQSLVYSCSFHADSERDCSIRRGYRLFAHFFLFTRLAFHSVSGSSTRPAVNVHSLIARFSHTSCSFQLPGEKGEEDDGMWMWNTAA